MAISHLIGESSKFQSVLEAINRVAPVDCAVLLRGETGTGKEVVARAIHDASPRRHKPFVAVNCAAIPSGLMESQLFGHERGAFTGAVTQAAGCFQAADRGTLLLDEIGDLPLELQPKLLRVLQERQLERVGGNHTVQVDVRIIAATNQDLWSMVQERKFRADLYYRLDVFPIMLPPLRERKADVPLLVRQFLDQYAARNRKAIVSIPDAVMEALCGHNWPGNVRELQNCIERAVIMSSGPDLRLPFDLFETSARSDVSSDVSMESRTLFDVERDHITSVLNEVGWVVGGPRGAAVRLGLPRTTLIARMCKLGIASRTSRLDTMRVQHLEEPGNVSQRDRASAATQDDSYSFGVGDRTFAAAGLAVV